MVEKCAKTWELRKLQTTAAHTHPQWQRGEQRRKERTRISVNGSWKLCQRNQQTSELKMVKLEIHHTHTLQRNSTQLISTEPNRKLTQFGVHLNSKTASISVGFFLFLNSRVFGIYFIIVFSLKFHDIKLVFFMQFFFLFFCKVLDFFTNCFSVHLSWKPVRKKKFIPKLINENSSQFAAVMNNLPSCIFFPAA